MSDWEEIREAAKRVDTLYQEKDKERLGRPWTMTEFLAACATDWGELAEEVLKREGLRPGETSQEALEHELADLLWALLVLSDRFGVDLGQVFVAEMKKLEERLA